MTHDDAHWVAYNAVRGSRPARDLLIRAAATAGPGRGRAAIDLGCGAGVETRALLDAGWRVHAIDGAPGTEEVIRRTVGGVHDRLTVANLHYADLTTLPPADLIYSGYALPYQPRESFDRIWALIRGALRPGGVLAVNLFGDHDEWAGTEGETFLTAAEARALVTGLDVIMWDEEDAPGPAYGGDKHWHVFHVVARRP
ncbi:class I SAM-dependent methyltransferase [Actinoplanes sp. RD1]|uniref:class I SAM-dependent methyltransferase n=1 Tax=Actinoplanes sp. RD1 TaxID=3064538 RepID=UPI002742989E|nr:class I SAM-dependent methyltransferase [Actinoplanes sp. RD1]